MFRVTCINIMVRLGGHGRTYVNTVVVEEYMFIVYNINDTLAHIAYVYKKQDVNGRMKWKIMGRKDVLYPNEEGSYQLVNRKPGAYFLGPGAWHMDTYDDSYNMFVIDGTCAEEDLDVYLMYKP